MEGIQVGMKRGIIEALEKRYEATIAEMHAEINILLNNSVGIGEHSKIIDEVDQKVTKIAEAEEKLQILVSFKF